MNTFKTVRIPRALALQKAEQRRADREAVERHLAASDDDEPNFFSEVRDAARQRRVSSAHHLVGVRFG